MSIYLVTYDLHTPGQKYQKIFDTIQRISSGHCKVLLSVWVVAYTGTAEQLYNQLKQHLDYNDHIFVAEISYPNWSGYLDKDVCECLRVA